MTRGPTAETPERLVSVGIPAYNHERFIAKTLDSIRDEGHKNIEVLLVDDGSSDRTFEAAQAWRSENAEHSIDFRAWRQSNSGVTKTLNRLVANANGDFFVPLASDDTLIPGGIAARMEALDSRPDWAAVFGDCIVIDEKEDIVWASGLSDLNKLNKMALLDDYLRAGELILHWHVPGPVIMFRRQAITSAGDIGDFDENLLAEDRDMYLRLLAARALGFIDRPVAAYRVHGRNSAAIKTRRAALLHDLATSERKNAARFPATRNLWLRIVAAMNESSSEFEITGEHTHKGGMAWRLWKLGCKWHDRQVQSRSSSL